MLKNIGVLAVLAAVTMSGMTLQASNIRGLQSQRNQLESQAQYMRQKRLEKLQAVDTLNNNIEINEERLDNAVDDLKQTQERYRQTQAHVNLLNKHLDITLTDLKTLARQSGKRLKRIYMGERLSMLQFAINATSANDFLDRVYYEQRIVAEDKRLLDQLREKGAILNSQRKELSQQQQLLAEGIHQIDSLKETVEDRIQLDKDLRIRYARDAAYYESAEKKLLAESQRVKDTILALTRRQPLHVAGGTGRFSWPLNGSLRSRFGYRRHPLHGTYLMHTGLDIAGGYGSPIRAADGGRVIFTGWRGGYGKVVMIYHGGPFVTLYGHMSGYAVGDGQSVGKGQVVGYVGSTGYSTGPHLHFEVRVNGSPMDPLRYL
jgi:murein DD-endopeptidase MepM/ murein hydrolase activator NlpD